MSLLTYTPPNIPYTTIPYHGLHHLNNKAISSFVDEMGLYILKMLPQPLWTGVPKVGRAVLQIHHADQGRYDLYVPHDIEHKPYASDKGFLFKAPVLPLVTFSGQINSVKRDLSTFLFNYLSEDLRAEILSNLKDGIIVISVDDIGDLSTASVGINVDATSEPHLEKLYQPNPPRESIAAVFTRINLPLFHLLLQMFKEKQQALPSAIWVTGGPELAFPDHIWSSFAEIATILDTHPPVLRQTPDSFMQWNKNGRTSIQGFGRQTTTEQGSPASFLPGLFSAREVTAAEIYVSRLPTLAEHEANIRNHAGPYQGFGRQASHHTVAALAALPLPVYKALLEAHFPASYLDANGVMLAVYRAKEDGTLADDVEFLTEDDFFSKYAVIKHQ